jgi:hypothetical protein
MAEAAAPMEAAGDSSKRGDEIMRQETINVIPCALIAMWTTSCAYPVMAQQPAQPTFPSAAEASQSLFQAVQSNNEQAIANILGGPTELTSSRDAGQDKLDREIFVQKYQEMHRLSREADRSVTLYIGAENWPFPFPLVSRNGAWHFDTDKGGQEILFRRIGENEVSAIEVCHGLVAAQRQPQAHDDAGGPIGTLLASATGSKPVHFQGYYFRMLSKSGEGFTAIAYPAEYRSSGVMTFVIDQDDIVREKDLGPNTAKITGATTDYHADRTWRPADTQP